MSAQSDIEWTHSTWNPTTGCTKISTGCKHCYAERMTRRLHGMGLRKYAQGFQLALHEELLGLPLTWKAPQMVFVDSMSDLFHEDMPFEFVRQVFGVMRRASWHTFQVLTKRSAQLLRWSPRLDWPTNVWMGVSVEDAEHAFRIDNLRRCGARVKFLSLEPLLGPLPTLDLRGIDWVIVGGESGPGARPLAAKWALDVRDCCVAARVPFFFKQWGGTSKKRAGRELQGRVWDEMPAGWQMNSPSDPRRRFED